MQVARLGWILASVFLVFGCAGTAPLAPKAVDLNRAGAEALAAGDFETAEARFALALEYHPRFVEALTNLGLVEMQRGNFSRARLQFERARRINPDLAQPHHALGVLCERERRPDVAAEHYRDALKVNPGFGPARANLGRLLFASGQLHDAREQFQRLVEVDPSQLAGHTGLAETLLQLGRSEQSDAVLERAQRAFGPAPELTILVARRHLRRGEIGEAESVLLPMTELGNDVARPAWGFIAAARLARDDVAGALLAAKNALELEKNDPLATYVVAMSLRATRDPRALVWLERARLLAPQNPWLTKELEMARSEPKSR